jgi:hypothetical protein
MYVFVEVRKNRREFYVVPSEVVARNVRTTKRPKSTWYAWDRDDRYHDAWHLFRP